MDITAGAQAKRGITIAIPAAVARANPFITVVAQSEPIRRVAVHVYPRARRGVNGARQRQSQTKTVSRLRVLVLVERLLPSAENERKQPKRHERTAIAAAPFSREVPRLDLVKGPLLRTWALTETAGPSAGRERHPTERVRARVARPDLASRHRSDKRRQK